jgi:hypothetical protein
MVLEDKAGRQSGRQAGTVDFISLHSKIAPSQMGWRMTATKLHLP